MLDLINSSINDSKFKALARSLRDLNQACENQSDCDYAASFKPNLNLEYLGYTLDQIAAYLELSQQDINLNDHSRKARVFYKALERIQTIANQLKDDSSCN